MTAEATHAPVKKIRIYTTDIFLENFDTGQGKITISDTYGHNYSYYWGSMGGTLEQFICRTDAGYFTNCLMGADRGYVMDVKKTFKRIREFIKCDLCLPWYKYPEFQKHMREKLNEFQEECEHLSQEGFVSGFYSFRTSLDFYLIKDKWDQKHVESDFKLIDEPWYFIETTPGPKYLWLYNFHKKLVKELKKGKAKSDIPQSCTK